MVIGVEGDRAVIRKVRSPEGVLERLLDDLTFSRELRRVAEREALREVSALIEASSLLALNPRNRNHEWALNLLRRAKSRELRLYVSSAAQRSSRSS